MAPKGSAKREIAIRSLMRYTITASLVHVVNTLLLLGANIWILLAIISGNVVGTYWSYERQESDRHDKLAVWKELRTLSTAERAELAEIMSNPQIQVIFSKQMQYGY